MLNLSREFANRGHDVDLVVTQATGVLRELLPERVKLIDLDARRVADSNIWLAISVVVRLSLWLRRERPTVMLSTVTGMNLAVVLARILARSSARLVIREATTLNNFRSRFRLLAMRMLYPRADLVVAVSPTVKRQLVSNLKVPEWRVRYIPNAVDVKFVQQQAQLPNTHSWLAEPGIRTVVAVGRLSPAKDYPTLLRAFSLIPRASKARLLVVGEGPERAELESLIHSLDISSRVQLVGFDINPWRWISRADVFVLSSKWEGHPNSLLEAIVLRRPSVVTAYDDSLNDLAATFGLLHVSPNDPLALAHALQQQLVTPSYPMNFAQIPNISVVTTEYLNLLETDQTDPKTQFDAGG